MNLPSFEQTFLGARLPVESLIEAIRVFDAGLLSNQPDLVLSDPLKQKVSVSLVIEEGRWSVTPDEFFKRCSYAHEGSYFRSVFLDRGGDLNLGFWFTEKSTRVVVVGISDEQVRSTASVFLVAAASTTNSAQPRTIGIETENPPLKHGKMPNPRDVMVVHGRDSQARKALFEFLRALDLRPLEWSELVRRTGRGAPLIAEILDVAFESAQAAVVLLTGDDEARLRLPLPGSKDPGRKGAIYPLKPFGCRIASPHAGPDAARGSLSTDNQPCRGIYNFDKIEVHCGS